MSLILWVALGGALGAVGRHLLTAAINQVPTGPWKLGTLAANLLGCFLFGLIWAKADQKMQLESQVTLALLVGFLGAFTTFSTYAFQTVALIRQADYAWAAMNLLTHNGLGLLMVIAGLAAAGGLTPPE
jgi:CrcB protein